MNVLKSWLLPTSSNELSNEKVAHLVEHLSQSFLTTLHTAGPTHSRSIRVLCYDLRLLWHAKSSTKSHATPLGFRLQTDIDWIIKWITINQMPSSNGCKVIGHQSWHSKENSRPFGFEITFSRVYIVNRYSLGNPSSIPGRSKLWRSKFLTSFVQHG